MIDSSLLIKIPIFLFLAAFIFTAFSVFFDQAILTRKGTIYRVKTKRKEIVLTFDDGPSPEWTPQILDALKQAGVKATFFMIGHHVKKYPEIARRVAEEGHIIGNHGYAHSTILYYKPAEIEEEIKYTESVIRDITGQTTQYFRPPKAWLRRKIKNTIKDMGYEVVLWSINSKDWVMFNHRTMVKYLLKKVRNGDIILFHDSGNVFGTEGGIRRQTVKVIPLLVEELSKKGFDVVSIDELISSSEKKENS